MVDGAVPGRPRQPQAGRARTRSTPRAASPSRSSPPRSSASALQLLSGGERALVAIAFLMALVLARPCPFYILDEIEAALDDVNIGRLVQLLRDYRRRTQFVIITHQKRTMEAADVLYGVTMGPDGASQVVSARMAEEEIEREERARAEQPDARRREATGRRTAAVDGRLTGVEWHEVFKGVVRGAGRGRWTRKRRSAGASSAACAATSARPGAPSRRAQERHVRGRRPQALRADRGDADRRRRRRRRHHQDRRRARAALRPRRRSRRVEPFRTSWPTSSRELLQPGRPGAPAHRRDARSPR